MKCCAVLRPMDEADLDAVVTLEAQLSVTPWSRGNFSDSLATGHRAVVCLTDDALCGYGVVSQVLDEAELLILGVGRRWQRQGLATQLLDVLCQRAREAGARMMHLEVRASNLAAQGLYQGRGFVIAGRRKAYYAGPHGREDALLMSAPL